MENEQKYAAIRRPGNNKLANEIISVKSDVVEQLAKAVLPDIPKANKFTAIHSWLVRHRVVIGLKDLQENVIALGAVNGEMLSAAMQTEVGIISAQNLPNSGRLTKKQVKELDQANEEKQRRLKREEFNASNVNNG